LHHNLFSNQQVVFDLFYIILFNACSDSFIKFHEHKKVVNLFKLTKILLYKLIRPDFVYFLILVVVFDGELVDILYLLCVVVFELIKNA